MTDDVYNSLLPMVEAALIFAYAAHGGQVRKYTGEPYICHPIAVAATLQELGYDANCVAAALLHDVVEDTPATSEDLRETFGDCIANLVAEVTDISKPEDGNRAARKKLDRQHIAKASPYGKDIKLADLIDNTKSISQNDKAFAKIYLAEKLLLLEVMDGANPVLLTKAKEAVRAAMTIFEEKSDDKNNRSTTKGC